MPSRCDPEAGSSCSVGFVILAWLREMAAVGIPVDLSVAALDVEIEHAGGVLEPKDWLDVVRVETLTIGNLQRETRRLSVRGF